MYCDLNFANKNLSQMQGKERGVELWFYLTPALSARAVRPRELNPG